MEMKMNMKKVVVVEDEKFVREGIIMGTDWGSIHCAVVGEATNGEEGMELIRKRHPDIVISDIRMPRLSGLEMLERLEKEGIFQLTIFLTAFDDFAYAQKACRLQAVDYLLKPFREGQLEKAIADALHINQSKNQTPEGGIRELRLEKGDKSKYILEAIAWIEQYFAKDDISIRTAAEQLGISEGYLSRLFRKETDYTFMAYVMQCRICEAKKLLKGYKYKVYEVAEMVGYQDIAYFSTIFKKYVGVSPSEYRDRYKE